MAGLVDSFKTLFSDDTNRTDMVSTGILDLLPELSLDTPDEELIKLSNDWEKKSNDYMAAVKKRQEKNKNYWLGKHLINQNDPNASVDNIIFEALETFLPLATKKNPDPFVRADNTPEGIALAKTVQTFLTFHADRLRMKLRLKKVTRDWAIKLIGYKKHGWDEVENDITSEVRDPSKLILDPDGTINCDMEFTGRYIGEWMEETATNLVARFPAKKQYITLKVEGKMGTKIPYIEYWANNPSDYVFWKLDNTILGKAKNPNWNYEETQNITDEYGTVTQQVVAGKNHFNAPKAPYTFLGGVFNTGCHPHDETSLIEQNISNQDIIDKRQKQIDYNADSMNGGLVISGEKSGLTQDQATDATEAIRKGGTVYIPNGNANEAIYRDQAHPLPSDIFNQLADSREELRNIFGTRGSSPSGTVAEQTATGKQIVREQDSDRIGGGISEYLEQFADATFNWWVQLMYVYYDEEHTASVVGQEKALEWETLKSDMLVKKLLVSVKEGSMVPDSDLEKADQAQILLQQGNLDPISAFDRMNFPDPRQTAERTYLWKASPDLLFPELGAQIAEKQQQEQMNQMAMQQQVVPKK